MIQAIAIDDEPIALDIIKAHAQNIPGLHIGAIFLSATEALTYVEANVVDLIFLDINMPGVNGVTFAEIVSGRAQIIFTTAYPEFALKGFDLAAADYLLKPINFSRFLQAYKQAKVRLQPSTTQTAIDLDTLLIKDGNHWIRVIVNGILFIVADDNYVSIMEPGKRTHTRSTLTEVLNKLPPRRFCRIHKSYIVPLAKIEKVERYQVTIGSTILPVSRSYWDNLLQQLNAGL